MQRQAQIVIYPLDQFRADLARVERIAAVDRAAGPLFERLTESGTEPTTTDAQVILKSIGPAEVQRILTR